MYVVSFFYHIYKINTVSDQLRDFYHLPNTVRPWFIANKPRRRMNLVEIVSLNKNSFQKWTQTVIHIEGWTMFIFLNSKKGDGRKTRRKKTKTQYWKWWCTKTSQAQLGIELRSLDCRSKRSFSVEISL